MSLRTRAILTESTEAPTASGTALAQQVRWELPVNLDGSVRVAEAAHGFVSAVLAVTERAVDGDRLEVRRHGGAPRFAARTSDDRQTPAAVRRATVMGLPLNAPSQASSISLISNKRWPHRIAG